MLPRLQRLFLGDVLALQVGRQRLGKFAGFLLVPDYEGVQKLTAAHLELHPALSLLLNCHHLGILPPRRDKELLDVLDLLRLLGFRSAGEKKITRSQWIGGRGGTVSVNSTERGNLSARTPGKSFTTAAQNWSTTLSRVRKGLARRARGPRARTT